MKKSAPEQTYPRGDSLRRIVTTLLLAFVALSATVAHAAVSPAEPVPESRWGSPPVMRPWSVIGDSTYYDGSTIPQSSTTIWFAADMAGGYLLTSTGNGVMVHNVDGNPKAPQRLGYTWAPSALPQFFQSDLKFYIYDIDAPGENSDVAATVGAGQGLVIWDLSAKSNPRVHYQDYQRSSDGSNVWAGRIGTRDWAFMAAKGEGVHAYDMSAASAYTGCNTASGPCSDVYGGTIPVGGSAERVDGVGNFLAVALSRKGLEVWDVSNPRGPRKVLEGLPQVRGNYSGVAIWQSAGRYYLAATNATTEGGDFPVKVWDVTCISSNTCASAQPFARPVASLSSNGYFVSLLKISKSEGRTYLYVGELDRFASGDQREFLWDVTDPAQARELTPDNPTGLGYWGWYYARNDTGFRNVAPMEAVVRNGYVYRAAWTVLDVHEILGASPPVADFTWSPQPVYQGQAVSFSDLSSGAPTSWFWSFSGATPSSTQSTLRTPQVTFGSVGTATVTLSASNDAGPSDPVIQQVPILDPVPSVAGVSFVPAAPLVCQQVTFSAFNVNGRPPLAYQWTVKDSSGAVVAGPIAASDTYVWDTSGAAAGAYTAEVQVSNGAGQATAASGPVTLAAPPALQINSGPTTDPFNFGTVQFHAATQGAASWIWDFGDGSGAQTFTNQAEGENPVHNYTQVGTYNVTLTVDNCLEAPVQAQIQVQVSQIDPLEVDQFQAMSQCQFGGIEGGCFSVGKQVEFDQSIGGNPDTYEYDWDGDGTWDTTASSPVLNHTYNTAGTFLPKVRVTRGNEPPVTVANGCSSATPSCAGTEIIVSPALPASITVSGPSNGQINQALSFSALATNCSPSVSGWTWSASGGSVSGSGSSVQVTWSSTGNKTVTAKNSSCGNVSGTKVVNISSGSTPPPPPPPSNNLDAKFSVTPSSPEAGKPASFDATASTGSPTGYSWDFGDGSTATGKTVSHSYSRPGSYNVKLSVSAPGDCQSQVGGLDGVCFDSLSKNVVVRRATTVTASFEDDAECESGQVGGGFCLVPTGQVVTFTDTSDGAVAQRSWSFGDGASASGRTATHQWGQPGTYIVTLTVQGDGSSDSANKTYIVSGAAVSDSKEVVLPWIAQADPDKALQQESDLYVHNPGPGSMEVTITFRNQGLPEPDPPTVTREVPEHGTLYLADVVKGLFNRPNSAGFLLVEPKDGDPQPVVTSFNRTFQGELVYGQAVPGLSRGAGIATRESGAEVLHLIGLHDTVERLGYFGLTNPTDERVDYNLSFVDQLGEVVGATTEPLAVARFGQKQFRINEIREVFGVQSLEDYRVVISPVEGSGLPVPYGANLRTSSNDPSFLRAGRTDAREVFLVGALNTPGLNNSFFHTDLVLTNTTDQPALVDVTFTGAGFLTEPTPPIKLTLPPQDTTRLADVVSEWDLPSTVGALRVTTGNTLPAYPVVQGESYDATDPEKVYGQFMPALTVEDAAASGKPLSIVGLRQDADHRSTVWLYNPGDVLAEYTLTYFDHGGNELGSESGLRLGAGKFRQINPGSHPLPLEGIADGFVVRVEVASGQILATGQVVNQFNDPAYLVGR